MKRLFAAAAVALCLAGNAIAAPDAAETAQAFHAALKAGDVQAASALLADDLTVYEEGHVERSKAEYLRSHLPDDMAFSRAVADTTTDSQTFMQGDTAWVIRETATNGSFQGRDVDRVGTETMILRLGTDGWRIVHIHWSSHKAPATTPKPAG